MDLVVFRFSSKLPLLVARTWDPLALAFDCPDNIPDSVQTDLYLAFEFYLVCLIKCSKREKRYSMDPNGPEETVTQTYSKF